MRLFAVALLFVAQILSAQDMSLLDRLSERISKSCLELDYSYSLRISGVSNIGQGRLQCQGYMWKMAGNGVEMYCDSSALWVVDPANKEVVIEPAEVGEKVQLQTNPAVLFVHMKELFAVRESRRLSQQGTILYILEPKKKGNIDYFNVEIADSDLSLRNAVISLSDGTLIKIEVSSMKLTPVRSVEDFRPRTVFDSSWIVTDLR
jgi:hypothetical protein